MRIVVPLVVAAALLAACGPQQKASAPDPAAAAQAKAALAQAKAGGAQVLGLARPSNLPAYALLPPDAFVTGASEGEQGPRSGWVEYSTGLSPGAVAAFYAEALASAGLADIRRGDGGLTAAGQGRTTKVTIRPLDGVGSEVRLGYS